MEYIRRRFRWMASPQLLVGFALACLGVSALGSLFHPALVSSVALRPETNVKAAATVPPASDCSELPCMALTFDDGPSATVTPQILDILAREQVKATFFVVGQRVPGKEAIVQRMYREGHEIGNHSWDHPDFTKLMPEEVENQLQMTQAAISATGVPAPRIFRPPYGAVNPMVLNHAHMPVVRWSIDTEDWKSKDAGKINQSMMSQVRPGGVILLHDTDQATADALAPTLQALKPHYQFVPVSKLLGLTPGDQGQYFGR